MSRLSNRSSLAVGVIVVIQGCVSGGSSPLRIGEPGPSPDPQVTTRWLYDVVQLRREGKQSVVVSEAGGYLVFQRVDAGDRVLSVEDLATGEVRDLSRAAVAYPVIVSPDGGWIAYESQRRGESRYELRVIQSDGTGDRLLVGHSGPDDSIEWAEPIAWSADGSSLVVNTDLSNGSNRLDMFRTTDDSPRTIKTFETRWPSGVGVSPDGRFVAYAYQSDDDLRARDIHVLALNGLREARITDDGLVKTVVGWSVDGSALYYEVESYRDGRSVSSIWRLPMEDGRVAGEPLLMHDDLFGNVQAALDGERLIVTRTPAASAWYLIATLDLDAGEVIEGPSNMVWTEIGAGEVWGYWTPDGREFAFTRPSQGPRAGWEFVLYSPGTGDTRVIPLGISRANEIVPIDDHTMVVRGLRLERDELMVRVDLSTGRVTDVQDRRLIELLDGSSQYLSRIRFSPDQAIKYFPRQRDGMYEIVAREVATGVERVVHRDQNEIRAFNPIPSPDGRRLAVLVNYAEPHPTCPTSANCFHSGVYVIPEAGGAATLIHRGSIGGNSVSWTSDSRRLYFTDLEWDQHGGSGIVHVWIADVDGSRRAELFTRRGPGIRPNPHPDNRRLVIREVDNARQSQEIWALENLPETRQ